MARRCHSLDRERGARPVAGDARLAELSPQLVWTRELPGLSVRRAASEPCSVRPAQRTAVRGVCSRRPCQRGRAVDNGRSLQDLLVQAGPRYVKALTRERASAVKRKKS